MTNVKNENEIIPVETFFLSVKNEYEDFLLKSERLVFDYQTIKGQKEVKSYIYSLRQIKSKIESVRKDAKDEALKYGRRVDACARELTQGVEGLIEKHKAPLDEIENREKERKKRNEDIINDLNLKIEIIKSCVDESELEKINLKLVEYSMDVFDDDYKETIQNLIDNAFLNLRMQVLKIEKEKREKEEREKAERARLLKEQEEREASIRAEAEAEAARKIEREKARLAEEAIQAIENAKIAERLKAEREIERQKAEEKAKFEEEYKKKRDEVLKAERARAQAEKEQKEREEQEKLQRHRMQIFDAIEIEIEKIIQAHINDYSVESLAKALTVALMNSKVPHTKVTF